MFDLVIELLVALTVYFLTYYCSIAFLSKRNHIYSLFTKSITKVNILALLLVLVRLISLLYTNIPFFEQYILYAIYYPIFKILSIASVPFDGRAVAAFIKIVVLVFCTILFLYHLIAQVIMLKIVNPKRVFIIIFSTLWAYLTSSLSVFITHKLLYLFS